MGQISSIASLECVLDLLNIADEDKQKIVNVFGRLDTDDALKIFASLGIASAPAGGGASQVTLEEILTILEEGRIKTDPTGVPNGSSRTSVASEGVSLITLPIPTGATDSGRFSVFANGSDFYYVVTTITGDAPVNTDHFIRDGERLDLHKGSNTHFYVRNATTTAGIIHITALAEP